MQPNLRRAPKSYYGNYRIHLMTSLNMYDGKFTPNNFATNVTL